ncbi:hypothetical protein GDO81_017985 [Engystomops pustulosus]|uniref:Uncharacterized protein n=1 Tax=Engystomops pustulosus TaxID=76066 RepID=A0AAV7A3W5_ENGPU|nr:hypothetical protein GDO81_017985 [Engystomops pustulosus]
MTNLGTEKNQTIAQLLLIPINNATLMLEGSFPSEVNIRGDKSFGSSDINFGAKIWVLNNQGPPSPTEVIAVGKAIMRPGVEKWEYVPQEKCYLRE